MGEPEELLDAELLPDEGVAPGPDEQPARVAVRTDAKRSERSELFKVTSKEMRSPMRLARGPTAVNTAAAAWGAGAWRRPGVAYAHGYAIYEPPGMAFVDDYADAEAAAAKVAAGLDLTSAGPLTVGLGPNLVGGVVGGPSQMVGWFRSSACAMLTYACSTPLTSETVTIPAPAGVPSWSLTFVDTATGAATNSPGSFRRSSEVVSATQPRTLRPSRSNILGQGLLTPTPISGSTPTSSKSRHTHPARDPAGVQRRPPAPIGAAGGRSPRTIATRIHQRRFFAASSSSRQSRSLSGPYASR
jgi:hypothetical protein